MRQPFRCCAIHGLHIAAGQSIGVHASIPYAVASFQTLDPGEHCLERPDADNAHCQTSWPHCMIALSATITWGVTDAVLTDDCQMRLCSRNMRKAKCMSDSSATCRALAVSTGPSSAQNQAQPGHHARAVQLALNTQLHRLNLPEDESLTVSLIQVSSKYHLTVRSYNT